MRKHPLVAVGTCLLAALSCTQSRQGTPQSSGGNLASPIAPAAAAPPASSSPLLAAADPANREIAELMYDGKLVNGWEDWGWGPRELNSGPARLRFDNWAGWMLAKPGFSGDYGGVLFRVKLPPGEEEFQQIWLETNGRNFPKVTVGRENHRDLGDGWSEVFVPMSQLNPDNADFERVAFHTFRKMPPEWILIDKVALTKVKSIPPPIPAYDQASLPRVPLSVKCSAKATKISPMIYGINQYASFDAKRTAAQWLLGATARRWGGNTTSDYNWQVSAWNTGGDWFYEDVQAPAYTDFFKENEEHGMVGVLSVPIMGWVAKDQTSFSFPVSAFGAQEKTDEWRKDAGNGKDKSGKELTPGPQSRAYVPASPEFVRRWIEAIRQEDQKTGKRSVWMYILDNEPGLWWRNHRDAHPDPVSYDELVQRTIDYGTAIRQADPQAVIAGPAEWGWMNFMYSAKDQASGPLVLHPDRRAHDDLPLIAYYLKALADHEKKTGVRVLDVLDLHAYATEGKVGGDDVDEATAALRIRSTRMLWDGSYVDESWIKQPIRLIPQMHEWVDTYYPGLGLSIGEWNFGAEGHMSGALATAEALGRFGQNGLLSAFYWVYPPDRTPSAYAFRAFRNFDGNGGHFLDWSEPATGSPNVSIFASRDDSGSHLVAIVLNRSNKEAVIGKVDVSSCGTVTTEKGYIYTGRSSGFAALPPPPTTPVISQVLPPYSITVLDLGLSNAVAVSK
jgi:hypothetical protein